MKEERRAGPLLTLGLLVMPYVFVWVLLRGNYCRRDKVFGFAWTVGLLGTLAFAVSQAPTVGATTSEPDVAGVQSREDGLISYKSRFEPAYRKFMGKWARDSDSSKEFSFHFDRNGAHVSQRAIQDGIQKMVVLPAADVLLEDCERREAGYGVIGDSGQRIGLSLEEYQKGAYYYQIVCEDYGSASGHILVKDSMSALTAYTCHEKECNNSSSYVDVSGGRHYEEESVAGVR